MTDAMKQHQFFLLKKIKFVLRRIIIILLRLLSIIIALNSLYYNQAD